MIQLEGKYNKDCKIFIDDIEESVLQMIYKILDDEVSLDVPVRIMPDTHAGSDIVIGFTMPVTDRINPNHVGVDIGCGVLAKEIYKPEMSLKEMDERIRKIIPMGFSHRNKSYYKDEFPPYNKLATKIGLNPENVARQLGTLGGGNHFIEIGKTEDDRWFLLIHSGSRNFGLNVCNYHAKKALANGSKYLFDEELKEYLEDMEIAQIFALDNRIAIMCNIIEELDLPYPGKGCIDTVHNYIDMDDFIIRKGAVKAAKGQLLVIPMNMRDGVLLCKGKGNPDWNYSAPHGAGRVLSRSEAKKKLQMEEFEKEMKGIYSSSVCESTLDESPMAYKDAKIIQECIGDTVEIIDLIKPVLNIKSC